MPNFYPGPSKLYPNVRKWLVEIHDSGILSMNHRSDAFMEMLAETTAVLKEKLIVPKNYEVYFTSSATECWEIVNQSLLQNKTLVAFNGAFGEKWFTYAKKNANALHRTDLIINRLDFEINKNFELSDPFDSICLTHNETSNGTALTGANLRAVSLQNPNALIAVDATSSMAGVDLPLHLADVWFASVQKCFGLPAGLAVMLVSPHAISRANERNENAFYNSFVNIRANFLKNQTPYTPNVLGIALLNKAMKEMQHITEIHQKVTTRAADLYDFIENETPFSLLVNEPTVRSSTVFAIECKDTANVVIELEKNGITVGKGYGKWKDTTFRIANFPAIDDAEFEILKYYLSIL